METYKYVVQVGDEYVSHYSVWGLTLTDDIFDAAIYGYDMALEIANSVGGKVVVYE